MASSSSKPSLDSRFLSLGASVSYLVFHSVINHYQLLFAKKKTERNMPGQHGRTLGEVTVATTGYYGTMTTYRRVPIGSKLISLTVLYEPFF